MTEFYQFKNLSRFSNVQHFVTTRKGGVSPMPLRDLNISFETIDNPFNVLKNREIVFDDLGIDTKSCVMQNQVHGTDIAYVSEADKGKGYYSHKDVIGDFDAMITDKKDICLFLFAADCVPILMYDTEKQIIAAVHSGWQGTVKQIAKKTVKKMTEMFDCKPQNIYAAIGPSISAKNYEVGQNVVDAVIKSFNTSEKFMFFNEHTGKYHFDLWYTNRFLLTEAGIPEQNIEMAGICTYENSDMFFSARRNEPTGRFGAGIMLKEL